MLLLPNMDFELTSIKHTTLKKQNKYCHFTVLIFPQSIIYLFHFYMLLYSLVSFLQFFFFFFNWDSPCARLNSHYEAWSDKKKSTKKITRYRKSVQKELTVKRCLLILDFKPLRSQVKGKHSIGREFQSLAARGKKLLTQTSL